jgi:thiosulfate/3-mercaptopyruvate sulfurtransferase
VEFVNPDAVASAQWLADRLDDPFIAVVDTRYSVEIDEQGRFRSVPGADAYRQSHVPGAVFLNLDDLRDPDLPTHILRPEAFAETMSQLGIGSSDEIVVYDTEGGTWAARLWWALRYHGHDAVRILDGGFVSWTRMGLPTEESDVERAAASFEPRLREQLRVEMSDVLEGIDEPGTVIVDALPEPFYVGRIPLYPGLRCGHIPGARNIPAHANVDPATWKLLPPADLAVMWEQAVGGAERIVTYCGGGVYGAFDLFVLHLLGYDAALYDASWEEWGAAEALPIETGPDTTRSEEQ